MSAPTPWNVHPLDSRMIVDADGFVVADVRVSLSEGCHAIALKLAAAPEMVDLLKYLQAEDYLDSHAYDRVEAMIAKAEGRERG